MIELINYRLTTLAQAINLKIDRGEIYNIVIGKASEAKIIAESLFGFHNDYEGEIKINGNTLTDENYKIGIENINLILNEAQNSFIYNTIEEELIYKFELEGKNHIEIEQELNHLSEYFQIKDINKSLTKLSTGQAQLINILSKLDSTRKVVIFVGVLLNLDQGLREKLVNYLAELNYTIIILSQQPVELVKAKYYTLEEEKEEKSEQVSEEKVSIKLKNNDSEKFKEIVEMAQNKLVVISGPNGSGKTTLMMNYFYESQKSVCYLGANVKEFLLATNLSELIKKFNLDLREMKNKLQSYNFEYNLTKDLLSYSDEQLVIIQLLIFKLSGFQYFLIDESLELLPKEKFSKIMDELKDLNKVIITHVYANYANYQPKFIKIEEYDV